jgi:hypothetical protein
MAPDEHRYNEYAKHLSQYLGIKDDERVGFEDVTISVGLLYPLQQDMVEHPDQMNDSMCGYTRTGVFNAVFTANVPQNNEVVLVHFQILCNFRKVIREYLFPSYPSFTATVSNVKAYLSKWNTDMQEIFGKFGCPVPSPFDRTHFFLDDELQYKCIQISNRPNFPNIFGEYLLTTVNPSRVLSFSMIIDALFQFKDCCCFDQLIELCFTASLLNNPFWFDYIMRQLIARHKSPSDKFHFDIHPFYDWIEATEKTFGAWQGGPYNRWSPCGGTTSIPVIFGAHATASSEERVAGRSKLKSIVQILHNHLLWVNSLCGKVTEPIKDLPLSAVEYQMTKVTREVANVTPCQFSLFRLSVFTTLAVGTGQLRPGLHLKALMFPVKGLASSKHLNISETETIRKMEHKQSMNDRLMLCLSNTLEQPRYLRDEMECLLCESHPSRNAASKDWFRRGQRVFDCNQIGQVLHKKYGRQNLWEIVDPPGAYQYAFLQSVVYFTPMDEQILDYAKEFGRILRNNTSFIRYQGRHSKTSNGTYHYQNSYMKERQWDGMSILRHRVAHFFRGGDVDTSRIQGKMHVLGDGEYPKDVCSDCNNLEQYEYACMLQKRISCLIHGSSSKISHGMNGACYHQHIHTNEDGEEDEGVLFYPGHIDKPFVSQAWFVPLSEKPFYTFISSPISWNIEQDQDSLKRYHSWVDSLESRTKQSVEQFLQDFRDMAAQRMKTMVNMLIYYCNIGSVLAFPANTCFHATITPSHYSTLDCNLQQQKRDLIIFHPLVFASQM